MSPSSGKWIIGFQIILFVINVVITRLVIFTCLCILSILFLFFFNIMEVRFLRFLPVVADILSGGSSRPARPVKKSWGSTVIVQAVGSGLDLLGRFL